MQPTMEALLEKRKIWDINDPRAVKVSHGIVNMMAKDAEPFHLVEREGFKELISSILPNYKMPSRSYFSRSLMPKMYSEMKSSVKEKVF